jgi:hypothetical protein
MCTRLCYTSTVAVQKMILIINRESNFLGGLYDPSSSGLSFVEKQKTSEQVLLQLLHGCISLPRDRKRKPESHPQQLRGNGGVHWTPPFPRRRALASGEMGGSSGPPHFPGVVEGVIQVSAFVLWRRTSASDETGNPSFSEDAHLGHTVIQVSYYCNIHITPAIKHALHSPEHTMTYIHTCLHTCTLLQNQARLQATHRR